jgi:hypothetical protein
MHTSQVMYGYEHYPVSGTVLNLNKVLGKLVQENFSQPAIHLQYQHCQQLYWSLKNTEI